MISKIFRKLFIYAYTFFLRRKIGMAGKGLWIKFPCSIYSPEKVAFGKNVYLKEHVHLNCIAGAESEVALYIGDNVTIGRFCHINAYQSVIMEDDVLIADRVFISDVSHEFRQKDISIMFQGHDTPRPVRLKKGCWIGVGVSILPGVTIGQYAVVGANAVVTKDVPDYHIAVGVPAVSRPITYMEK